MRQLKSASLFCDREMIAMLEKAGAKGVAVELNADPHRLDLDWRLIPQALAAGAILEIGPDAHSTAGLDNVVFGVGMARKAGVTRAQWEGTRRRALRARAGS